MNGDYPKLSKIINHILVVDPKKRLKLTDIIKHLSDDAQTGRGFEKSLAKTMVAEIKKLEA